MFSVHPPGRRGRRSAIAFAVAAVASLLGPSVAHAAPTTFGYSGPAGIYAYGFDFDPSDHTILVGDYWNYAVKRFTGSGSFVARYADNTHGSQNLASAPYDVEADGFDSVGGGAAFWAADQGSSNIVEFSHTGQWLQTIGAGGGGTSASHPGHNYSAGCGNGHMVIPTHMWVDPGTGKLYVSDPRCRNVYIFTHTGSYVGAFKWPSGSGTPIPRGVVGHGSFVYVAEFNHRAIYVFDKNGNFVAKQADYFPMNDVRGIDMNAAGTLIYTVSAIKNEIFEFSVNGSSISANPLHTWTKTGGTNGTGTAFNSIRFVAVDASGNVYTGDTWGCPGYVPSCAGQDPGYRIYKFTASGAPLPFQGPPSTSTSGNGQGPPPKGGYNQQNGLALDKNGHLFVVDTFEQRVQEFNTSSSCTSQSSCPGWVNQFGGREAAGPQSQGFGYPRALTYDSAHNYVWVGDNNNDVQAWNASTLQFVHRYGSQGHGTGQFSGGVQGIRVVGGKVYATDPGNCELQIFDESALLSHSLGLAPLKKIGGCSGTHPLSFPRGVDVSADGSKVYVAETSGNRISVWNASTGAWIQNLTSCGIGQPWGVTFGPGHNWLYVGNVGRKDIVRMKPDGSQCSVVVSGSVNGTTLKGSNYVEFDPAGNMYISDNSRHVFKIPGNW